MLGSGTSGDRDRIGPGRCARAHPGRTLRASARNLKNRAGSRAAIQHGQVQLAVSVEVTRADRDRANRGQKLRRCNEDVVLGKRLKNQKGKTAMKR